MKCLAVALLVLVAIFPFGIRTGALGNQDRPVAPKQEKQQPDYFPIALGNKWHLQFEKKGVKTSGIMEVVKVETAAGQTRAFLEMTMMGKKLPRDGQISTSDKGVFLHKLEPPVCLLKYPVKEGASWRVQSKNNGVEYLVVCTVGKWEQVEVPAGKFKAIKVHVEYEENVAPFTTDYWFAADVGIVMLSTSSLKGTTKLVKFEKAGDKK